MAVGLRVDCTEVCVLKAGRNMAVALRAELDFVFGSGPGGTQRFC